jgi:hypothetical protein
MRNEAGPSAKGHAMLDPFDEIRNFIMYGRWWTCSEDVPDEDDWWREARPSCLADAWERAVDPEFALYLLGTQWSMHGLWRPWQAWHGIDRFVEWCASIAGVGPDAFGSVACAQDYDPMSVRWFALDGVAGFARARRAAVRAIACLVADGAAEARARSDIAAELRRLVDPPFPPEAGYWDPAAIAQKGGAS